MPSVVFLTADLADPSARLRILNYLPLLREMNVEARAVALPSRSRDRWTLFRGLGQADVVVLHRKLLVYLELAFLRRHARCLVFDFDDALPYRVPWAGRQESWSRRSRFRRTIAWADGVIAGSEILMDLADPGDKRALVLSTPVDTEKTAFLEQGDGEPLVLGWIGQRSSLPYLEDLAPALDEVGRRNPRAVLHVIADGAPSLSVLPVHLIPWSEAGEARALAAVHVGLGPLRDDPWSRGKCGFKVLQYFAAGRPAVVSPVGMNLHLVSDGVNGFHAANEHEWVDRITRLLHDGELRRRLGSAGRALVEKEYSLGESAIRLADFLKRVFGKFQ